MERCRNLLLEIKKLIDEKEAIEEKRRKNNTDALEERMFQTLQKIYSLSTEYYYWMPKKGFEFVR